MTSETREQLIGAAALIFLVGFLVLLNQSRNIKAGPEGGVQIEALFGRIDGLGLGDEVRLGGVRIGTVKAQRLDENFRAVVTINLDADAVVPKDSSASVQTDGLFGGKFIVIEPGAEETRIKSGDRITRTQDSQIVGDLLDAIISEGRAAQAARSKAEPSN